MKSRLGFVSNSSSSSFIISKDKLTKKQIKYIKNHGHIATTRINNQFYIGEERSGWRIIETDNEIKGDTSMDNFDMYNFLFLIGVDTNDIIWDDKNAVIDKFGSYKKDLYHMKFNL